MTSSCFSLSRAIVSSSSANAPPYMRPESLARSRRILASALVVGVGARPLSEVRGGTATDGEDLERVGRARHLDVVAQSRGHPAHECVMTLLVLDHEGDERRDERILDLSGERPVARDVVGLVRHVRLDDVLELLDRRDRVRGRRHGLGPGRRG